MVGADRAQVTHVQDTLHLQQCTPHWGGVHVWGGGCHAAVLASDLLVWPGPACIGLCVHVVL